MDPITAALNVANSAILLLTKMYDGMSDTQKQQFNQPFIDGLKAWNDFGKTVAALMQPK